MPSWFTDLRQQVLGACDRHAVYAQRGRGHRAAEDEIVANGCHVLEHVGQVSGDGNFFNRVGELAVLDP